MSINDVAQAVKKLMNSYSYDVFNLSNNMFKGLYQYFFTPLMINRCLAEWFFPDELKLSQIYPKFKKKTTNLPESYRPTSIKAVLSKIVEIVVHDQLVTYLESNGCFNLSQYGLTVW